MQDNVKRRANDRVLVTRKPGKRQSEAHAALRRAYDMAIVKPETPFQQAGTKEYEDWELEYNRLNRNRFNAITAALWNCNKPTAANWFAKEVEDLKDWLCKTQRYKAVADRIKDNTLNHISLKLSNWVWTYRCVAEDGSEFLLPKAVSLADKVWAKFLNKPDVWYVELTGWKKPEDRRRR